MNHDYIRLGLMMEEKMSDSTHNYKLSITLD